MKKIFVFLICLLIASPAFAGKKPKKSPLKKLSKELQYEWSVTQDEDQNYKKKKIFDNPVGEIITFESGDAVNAAQILDGSYNKIEKITVTGHLTYPPGDGPFPLLINAHSSGGPGEFLIDGSVWWFQRTTHAFLDMGIAVLYLDNFSGRGCKDTWRDQSCASVMGQIIDAFEAVKYLKNNHPKINTKKIGITGYSRGGNVSFSIGEKRLSDVLGEGFEFAAAFGMSAECHFGLFENPIPNNTKMYVVHGELDDYTLPGPCMDYAKKLKDAGADVKSHLVKGGYHSFHGSWVTEYDKRIMTFNSCPDWGGMTDEGHFSDAFNAYIAERVDDWDTIDDVKAAFKADPTAAFTKGGKESLMHKKKGCATYGAHDGGDHGWQGKGKPFIPMSESKNVKYFTPIFLNFWKESLL